MLTTSNATEAAFWSSAVMRRQQAMFASECGCTRALHAEYARRHATLDRIVVLDGTGFRWEGLGNSGTRWMGLLRWGYATGRATFLRIARDEQRLDIGEYFVGWKGVDWFWAAQQAAVRQRLLARGVKPVVLEYSCVRRRSPGCGTVRLRHARNGSMLALFDEPTELLTWMRSDASPKWIRLVLQQQDSLEHSYSKPEKLRTTVPLTACPVAGAPDFSSREAALKCETYAFMQPRPKLIRALVPLLRRLEPYDVVVGVHLRTGYADWAFRNDDTYFPSGAGAARNAGSPRSWTLLDQWRRLDQYFADCRGGQSGPCFNWVAPQKGAAPRRQDALRCGTGWRTRAGAPALWTSLEGAPDGFLSTMLLCASRLGQAISSDASPGWRRRPRERNWGLLVLSDSPAFPSLATKLPALRGRAVNTAGTGAGQLGHSSFARSCSTLKGCSRGHDPGGAWTRSLVDFYLAGVADGFVKGLFTSFLYATMRRDLLCCRPGAFVQWLGWYNLSRSHRDIPMRDRDFLQVLTHTQG